MLKISLILIALFITPLAHAGGQLVSLYADVSGTASADTYGRIMRVYLNPDYPCKDTKITFKFVDPKEGDYIATGDGGATFTMKEDRNSNGCGTYAKVQSKVSGERMFTVEVENNGSVWASPPVIKVHFDGKYHTDNSYNNESYRSSVDDPYKAFSTTPLPVPTTDPSESTVNVWLLSQQLLAPYSRSVVVKWSAFQGAVSYIYGKARTSTGNWEKLASDQMGPSVGFNIRSDEDYYIRVQSCQPKVGNCIDSNILFLAKLKNKEIQVSSYPTSSPTTNIITSPDNNSDQLNQKIASLEAKLLESEKKQGFLEERINALVSFIKSLFPFFK